MATEATETTEARARTEPRNGVAFSGVSVRTRITAAFALLVTVALFGAGLVAYVLESAHIDEEVVRQIDQELAEFATLRDEGIDPTSNPPQEFRDLTNLIRTYMLRNVPDDDELLLGYWDGRIRIGTEQVPEPLRTDAQFLDVIQSRLDTGGTEYVDTELGEVAVTVQPVRDSQRSGAFIIATFLADEHEELNRIMQTYALVALLSLGLVTGVAAWQSGRLLAPVRTLRETAEEISETDLKRRIPERGNDDITDLTRTFNEMVARLDRAFTDQRDFLDDAGHELKTPLTVLRGHMELLDGSDPEDVKATRELLLEEIDRMSRLVGDLIMLAKADRPDFVRRTEVDVAPFTATVLDKCRALGDRHWELDERADLVVVMDPQRITQALLQLAQNAVKHTEESATVAVGSRVVHTGSSQRSLCLWVRDTGPGVADQDKAVVFDRFARGQSLASDEGFGLGLSIVRAIVDAHDGSVTVEDAVPHGARFVVTLPVRPEEELWRAS